MHIVALGVRIASDAEYDVRFDVEASPEERIWLHVDFYAPGFDEPDSERRLSVEPGDAGREVRVALPVKAAPTEVMLRVFYQGLPGLRISNLRISKMPDWLPRRVAWIGWLSVSLALLAVLAVLADDESRLWARFGHGSISDRTGVALVVVAYGVSVVARFLQYGATPYWSGDEYVYKSIAVGIWDFGGTSVLHRDHVDAIIDLPSLLYPYLVAPAFSLGEHFYTGIRLINSLVMSAAIFPAYAITRKFWDVRWAFPLAAFSVCVPAMGLGAYVVTEALFYPVLLTTAWAALRSLPRADGWGAQLLVGVLAAIAMNVRPTGTFLLPAYLAAYALYALYRHEAIRLYRKPTWLVALAAFGVVHFVCQATLRGPASEGLGLYAEILFDDSLAIFLKMLEEDPTGPMRLFSGHFLTLSVPYAFPLALLGVSSPVLRRLFRDQPDELALVVVAVMFSGALVGFTLVFTLYTSTFDLGAFDRWHARYYALASPLLLFAGVVAARRLTSDRPSLRWGAVAGSALIVLLGGAVLFWSSIPSAPWFGSIVDDMDVQWELYWPGFYLPFAALTTAGAALWALRRPAGLRLLICGLLVWVVVAGAGAVRHARVGSPNPDVACGRGLAGWVASSSGRLGVFGWSRATFVGLGFWLPRTPAWTQSVQSVAEIDRAVADAALDWVLVNGDFAPPTAGREILVSGNCRIYAIDP